MHDQDVREFFHHKLGIHNILQDILLELRNIHLTHKCFIEKLKQIEGTTNDAKPK